MPTQRFFIVEKPDIRDAAFAWEASKVPVFAARAAFLDEWGSRENLTIRGGSCIVGIKDPRQMDPPRELPKGWRKVRKHPAFVEPTDPETSKLLSALSLSRPDEAIRLVLGDIASASPEFVSKSPNVGGWMFAHDGKTYWASIQLHALEKTGVVLAVIPDPSLRFDVMPGYREVFQWEADAAIDAENSLCKAGAK